MQFPTKQDTSPVQVSTKLISALELKISPRLLHLHPQLPLGAMIDSNGLLHALDFSESLPEHYLEQTADHSQELTNLVWHPKQAMLATCNDQGSLGIWVFQSPSGLSKILEIKTSRDAIEHLTWNSDGSLLAVESTAGIRILAANANFNAQAEIPSETTRSLLWRPANHHLAFAARNAVLIYNPSDENFQPRVLPGRVKVDQLAWSPNGRLLAAWGQERGLSYWTFQDGRQGQISNNSGKIQALSWHPNSRTLAIGFSEEIHLWNFDGNDFNLREPQILFTPNKKLTCLSYAPKGSYLATGYEDGCLFIWNTNDSDSPLVNLYGKSAIAFTGWLPVSGQLKLIAVTRMGGLGLWEVID